MPDSLVSFGQGDGIRGKGADTGYIGAFGRAFRGIL